MLLSVFVLFALLQTSFILPAEPAPLSDTSLDKLSNVFPLKELQDVKLKHLKTDPSFQAAVLYFKSPEWAQIIEDVRKTPEWIEYKKFLKEAGVDLDYVIQHIDHCVNSTNTEDFKVEGAKPSLASFFNEIKMTYGILLMKNMHEYLQKVGQNDAHKKVMEQLTSEKSKNLLEKAFQQSAVKKMSEKLKEMDVNLDYVMQLMYSFNGWQPMSTTKA